ncbi:MAG: DUF5009 domain-containing protein [Clostridiaceae bacterium]|nr:DUF5009 domain-containing protein [Clostridiaceae bacterium]
MEHENRLKKSCETGRLKCIDAFRGMAIAIMLLCANPGNTDRIYPQLRHAKWNGYTFADLSFPFIIIIMGMVIPYALNRRVEKGISSWNIFAHILIRSVGLFGVGLFLNGFPIYDFSVIRVPGVLQRIAITYLITSCVTLVLIYAVKNKVIQVVIQLGLSLTIILGYSLIMSYVSIPGVGRGVLELEGNLVQNIDLYWLKGHLYTPNWDPEGIFSTVPAIATALLGAIAGQIFIYSTDKKIYKFVCVSTLGMIIVGIAMFAKVWVPFNKNLWSGSFVLLTAGIAFYLVAVLYYIMEIVKFNYIFKPLVVLGTNTIVVYLVSEILRKTLWVIPVLDPLTKKTATLNVWFTNQYITPWAGNTLDSFYFSIIYVMLWICIMSSFYNKRFIRRL